MSNNKNLKPSKKGEIRNPNGRPKNVLNQLQEMVKIDFGIRLSKADKFQLMEWLLERKPSELRTITKNKETPTFLVIIAKSILKDIEKGQMTNLNLLLDRFFGRPTQSTTTNVNFKPVQENNLDLSKLSDDELRQYKVLLERAGRTSGTSEA